MNEFYYRSNPRQMAKSVGRQLRVMCNKAWSLMLKVRLEQGEIEAQSYEDALRFLDALADECCLLRG